MSLERLHATGRAGPHPGLESCVVASSAPGDSDAIWWACVTITTVGYGDYYPVTFTGRIVAVGLMIGGITLIGVVTAALASWIVERVADQSTKTATAPEHQVEDFRREVSELKDMIRELRPAA